jgi:hypothetical protein
MKIYIHGQRSMAVTLSGVAHTVNTERFQMLPTWCYTNQVQCAILRNAMHLGKSKEDFSGESVRYPVSYFPYQNSREETVCPHDCCDCPCCDKVENQCLSPDLCPAVIPGDSSHTHSAGCKTTSGHECSHVPLQRHELLPFWASSATSSM